MTVTIEAGREFEESLEEFGFLLQAAANADNAGDEVAYSIYLKCALLLLTSKFECFLEELVEEVASWIKSANVPCTSLPVEMVAHYSTRRFTMLHNLCNQGKLEKFRIGSVSLAKFLLDHDSCDIEIDGTFSYGKHGEKEIAKLLKRIGITDPFALFKIEISVSEDVQQEVDVAGIINSLTSIRNNVLHQNASPQLTHYGLSQNRDVLWHFSQKLVQHVENMLHAMPRRTLAANEDFDELAGSGVA